MAIEFISSHFTYSSWTIDWKRCYMSSLLYYDHVFHFQSDIIWQNIVTMFSIPNLISFDKISTENGKVSPWQPRDRHCRHRRNLCQCDQRTRIGCTECTRFDQMPWKMEKRVEMNDDGMGMGISCENLKVRVTCTSSRIACLTRWAPGKQVQILSVLPTRSVWSITLWGSNKEWKPSHRDLPENRGRPRSFWGSSPPCHDRAPVR